MARAQTPAEAGPLLARDEIIGTTTMLRDAIHLGAPDGAPPTPGTEHRGPPSVSLALGSGGARGLAHIGVIQWLVEHGYRIRSIAGSSMGALIGGIHAANKLDVYVDWVTAMERGTVLRLLDPAFARGGLFKGERVIAVLRELCGDHAIESLPVAFTAVAMDLGSGEEVWLREGRLFDAIRASIAAPLIFTPFRHGERMLADGALVNPLPLAPVLHDATDLTIAVDLGGAAEALPGAPAPEREPGEDGVARRMRDFIGLHLERASDASLRWLTDRAFASMPPKQPVSALQAPDVTVSIPCNACGLHEFWRAPELIRLGRERAAQAFAEAGLAPRPASARGRRRTPRHAPCGGRIGHDRRARERVAAVSA